MVDYPDGLIQDALELLQKCSDEGKIKKGTNEVTKSIERGTAKLTFIATDVEPPEIIRHLPILCKEKNAPHILVPSHEKLGEHCGLDVSCASAVIIDAGSVSTTLISIAERLQALN